MVCKLEVLFMQSSEHFNGKTFHFLLMEFIFSTQACRRGIGDTVPDSGNGVRGFESHRIRKIFFGGRRFFLWENFPFELPLHVQWGSLAGPCNPVRLGHKLLEHAGEECNLMNGKMRLFGTGSQILSQRDRFLRINKKIIGAPKLATDICSLMAVIPHRCRSPCEGSN